MDWVDLREEPQNLPQDGERVLLCTVYESEVLPVTDYRKHYVMALYNSWRKEFYRDDTTEIINKSRHHILAWKRVDEFKGVFNG